MTRITNTETSAISVTDSLSSVNPWGSVLSGSSGNNEASGTVDKDELPAAGKTVVSEIMDAVEPSDTDSIDGSEIGNVVDSTVFTAVKSGDVCDIWKGQEIH